MSGISTQTTLLTNCIKSLLDKITALIADPTYLSIDPVLLEELDLQIESTKDILKLEEFQWTYPQPLEVSVQNTPPTGLAKTTKIEVQLENGEIQVARAGHLNWGNANSFNQGHSIFRYRIL